MIFCNQYSYKICKEKALCLSHNVIHNVQNACDEAVILTQSMHQPLNQTIYGILVITISAAIVGRIVTLGASGKGGLRFRPVSCRRV